MDQLLAYDERLYLAILAARSAVLTIAAIILTFANFQGLVWWVLGLGFMRSRGAGRRGAWVALTVAVGGVLGWIAAELLKLAVRRPRPFDAIPDVPPTLIDHPASFSFPSGDTALAFGAAVALGTVLPRLRPFALLLAAGIALSRLVTGVHYPLDVLGGAVVGIVAGLAARFVVAAIRRQLRWRVFIVPHTHWDREWYERFEGFRARLVPMVEALLDLLERDPRFGSFTFDGQTIALEDHLAIRPPDRPRIEALVRSGRLLVGPWYVLADLLLVSGESIVRNLQEGLRVAATFGRAARVCYVADPFGHPAQLPQVLRGFGYESYVFARGVGDEGEELGSEFRWEAPSGDRVVASHQVAHYNNALGLVARKGRPVDDVRRRVRAVLPRILDRTTPYAASDALLFMVGDDHTGPFERLPDAASAISTLRPRISARIASLEDFLAALPVPRGVFVGEMVAGKYRPILRGTNATRVWIKQENVACERLLLERCEPLDALAGAHAADRLRQLWRTLLENHPHDSICGCSIDAVHDIDMRPRFARVREGGERLVAELTASLGGRGAEPVVWSALPWPRDAVITLRGRPTLVRCAALGVAPAARPATGGVSAPEPGVIENEALRVEVAEDGSFVIVDRATGTRSGRQNLLLDEGDRGDEYTYSYAGPTAGSKALAGRRTTRVEGDRAAVTVELVLRLPAALRDDRLARRADLVDCPVRFVISLDPGAARVDVTATVTNAARDHRLRVLFETGVRSITHTAGAAFAWLERPNRVPRKRGWVEPPTAERCFHDFVSVASRSAGLAVGADGLRDYAVLHDGGTVALTLFRSVGWLSRSDLRERRGDAGPRLETPSAQCLGELTFRYCVVPLGAERGLADAVRAIREYLSPAWMASGDGQARSYCEVEGDPQVTLSALRGRSPDRSVIRLVNPTKTVAHTTVHFARAVTAARPVDLREADDGMGNTALDVIRTAAPTELRDGRLAVTLEPFEIGTYEVSFG
ncbi:MAG TPA: phosphatase PAP2 family protein [Candidatus Limnocylindria bacterium]